MLTYEWNEAGIQVRFASREGGQLSPEISLGSEKRTLTLREFRDFCIDMINIAAWEANGEFVRSNSRVHRVQLPRKPFLQGATITFEN